MLSPWSGTRGSETLSYRLDGFGPFVLPVARFVQRIPLREGMIQWGSYPMTKDSPGANAQWVRRCLMRQSLRGWGFSGFESHST